MVIIFIVFTTNDECEQDVIWQVGLGSCLGGNYVVVTCDTKTFLTVRVNSNLSTPICSSVSSRNLNFPDFPHPPHLLSETASRLTSEVEITNNDGLIHRDSLVRSSSWWPLPSKKPSTLRIGSCSLSSLPCSVFLVSCLLFVKFTQKSCSFWGESSHVSYITAMLTCLGSVDCEDMANEISVCVLTFSVIFEGDDLAEHIFTWQPTFFFSGLDHFKLQISRQCLFLFAIFLPGITAISLVFLFVLFFFLWFLFSLFFFYHSFCLHFYVVRETTREEKISA